ncbi:MAG TPA: CotH kinase family protein [Candidatus Limnocylindrales bacterium]|jgi:hypothetical protein|nr:CotH kinase family protein [Candidatus Limnocylindrales bacterium]
MRLKASPNPQRTSLAFLAAGGLLLALLAAALALQKSNPISPAGARIEPDGLYHLTNIWTVHFRFTADQWEAMEPKGGFGPFGGPGRPGGPGPFRGPGGPGPGPRGPGEGPGGFGPAMFLTPAFLKDGDANHDGRLSREEFQALAAKWFTAWDTNHSGKLDETKIRAGLNSALGSGGGMGPFGGPGNRRPGMNLQGPEGKRNGLASAMGIQFNYVHAELEFEGITFKDVGVRYKGNGTFMESRGSLKRSLKVDLNHFAKGQKLADVSKLNFNNNVTDVSWMNEVLSYRLYRDAGVPAPQTAYARVYVTVPGKFDHQYLGLYSLVEDVDRLFALKRFGTRSGAIFKPVTSSLFSDLGNDWPRYNQTYDPKTSLFDEQKQRVIGLARLVSSADDKTFAAKIGEFIDLAEFARFMAVMVFLSDMDGILGPGQNLYLYLHPKSQWFTFIPWDQDHSFGQFGMRGTQQQRENLSIAKPWDGENRFLERMYNLAEFQRLYRAALKEFSGTIFNPERFRQQVDEVGAAIRQAVADESEEKVARFDEVVAGGNVPQRGFGGRMGPPFGGFGDPMKSIKGFVKVRAQSISDQLDGKSEGLTVTGFGFRPGGRGPGGPPGGFGPGMFLGPAWMQALDPQKKGELSLDDFTRGFIGWFDSWNTDKSGILTEDQLRSGINQDLSPFRGGPPGGFGAPPNFPKPPDSDDR